MVEFCSFKDLNMTLHSSHFTAKLYNQGFVDFRKNCKKQPETRVLSVISFMKIFYFLWFGQLESVRYCHLFLFKRGALVLQ